MKLIKGHFKVNEGVYILFTINVSTIFWFTERRRTNERKRERERKRDRERGIKVFGSHPRVSVNKMAFHWEDLENLINSVGSQIVTLEKYRDSLYQDNREILRQLYSEEYCPECRGFCSAKTTKINHLRWLSRRLEALSVSLMDLVHTKLNYANLYPVAPFSDEVPSRPLPSIPLRHLLVPRPLYLPKRLSNFWKKQNNDVLIRCYMFCASINFFLKLQFFHWLDWGAGGGDRERERESINTFLPE